MKRVFALSVIGMAGWAVRMEKDPAKKQLPLFLKRLDDLKKCAFG